MLLECLLQVLIQLDKWDSDDNNKLFDKYCRFCYAFGGINRVFGYCGSLQRDGDRITVEDMLLCCSGICSSDLVADNYVSHIRHKAEQSGWRILEDDSLSHYHYSDVTLNVLKVSYSKGLCVHIILSYGKGKEDRYRELFKKIYNHISRIEINNVNSCNCLVDDLPSKKFKVLKSEKELVDVLSNDYNIAYTGAGVSLASGIETFVGNGSIERDLFPLIEAFPGKLFTWMIDKPHDLITRLCRFQSRFIIALPNTVHDSLAELEKEGIISYVITSNIDSLHQLAGSKNVIQSSHFARLLQSRRLHEKELPDKLLVIGLSRDQDGIINTLRSKGSQIVVIDTSPPSYLQANDLFYEGHAEKILPPVSQLFSSPTVRRYEGTCSVSQLEYVIDKIILQAPNRLSTIHGEHHWQCVAYIGLQLAKSVNSCDALLVLLFSVIHDSMRLSDGSDPDHPRKACLLVEEINHKQFDLSSYQMNVLRKALLYHSDGSISLDPTIGVCWDSDRLDLWRCGMIPEEDMLSTRAAKRLIQWSQTVHNAHYSWKSILNEYNLFFPKRVT
jgi:uncharacterized protein